MRILRMPGNDAAMRDAGCGDEVGVGVHADSMTHRSGAVDWAEVLGRRS